MTDTLDLARTNIASGVKEDDLKPIKDLLKMADRSPTDVEFCFSCGKVN